MRRLLIATFAFIELILQLQVTGEESFRDRVRHGFANSDGVKIHYATIGEGPLVVMIHGFPDFWYTWRQQMSALADKYQVVAMDMRGYNLSDKPKGVENYDMKLLVADVHAVIKHFKKESAIIVGHDWGGAVAWSVAMSEPETCDKLIVLNLPHPRGLNRELANNPQQKKNSAYARAFQLPDAHLKLTPEGLASWVKDKDARTYYVEAFMRSDFEAMLNYYKRNYPRPPYVEDRSPVKVVKIPVLMFHGLKDKALLSGALDGTWDWVEDLTLVTIPRSGHFVQQDASDQVTETIKMWLRLKESVSN